MNDVISYITAMVNMFDRRCEMVSTTEVVDNLNDLLEFVIDTPDEQVIEIRYDEDGSDGMDEINRFLLS